MKRFRFKLETLLDVKKIKEDEKKRDLAVVNRRLLDAHQVLRQIEHEWHDLQKEELVRRKAGTSSVSMGWSINYRLLLQERAEQQQLSIRRIMAEQEARRQALVKATQEKKALENIRENRLDEWKKTYRREEAKRVDDFAQTQYIRRQQAA